MVLKVKFLNLDIGAIGIVSVFGHFLPPLLHAARRTDYHGTLAVSTGLFIYLRKWGWAVSHPTPEPVIG
jgi:hypothetical protein